MLYTNTMTCNYVYTFKENYQIQQTLTGDTIKIVTTPTLLNYYEYFISQERLRVGFGLTESTLKTYNSRHKVIKSFIAYKDGQVIYPADLTIKIVREFELYLRKVKKHCNDYAMKNITLLGKILQLAKEEKDIKENPVYEYFECHYERKFIANYLEPGELNKLIRKQFTNGKLDRVKDIFLFSCYTGLSYCDAQRFRYSQHVRVIEGKEWIVMKRQKNVNKVIEDTYVPLLPAAAAILKKYNVEHLPKISNAKLNLYLKEVFEILDIPTKITTASGRKTFGMILHNQYKVPIETVSKMLGHSSIKTTEQWYVKSKKEKTMADLVNSDSFFAEQWRETIQLNEQYFEDKPLNLVAVEKVVSWFNSPFVPDELKQQVLKKVG